MTTAAREPVVDLDALLTNVGGDAELIDELADTFAAELPGWIIPLRAAVVAGDAAAIHRWAHSMKGGVAIFTAPGVQRAAAELEMMGREANLAGAAGALARLEAALAELGAFLRATPWRLP